MRTCECTIPDGGYCERHKCRKSARLVYLCRTRPNYFRAWEEGRGPRQKPENRPLNRPLNLTGAGVGTQLHRLLARFGIRPTRGCQCRDRALKMNRWGPDKCEQHIETILAWMREEADRRGLPFSAVVARQLVRLAIWRERRIQKKAHRENTQSGLALKE